MTPRPPTHREPTDKEMQCLPEGTLVWSITEWVSSGIIGEYQFPETKHLYAVPITKQEAPEPRKTLRDEFAMAALTGMWANHKCVEKGTDWMIAHALISADAMLAARNNQPEKV